MRLLPLEALPNQEFSINVDDNRWTLRVNVANLAMSVDLYLNNEVHLLGQRIAPGTPVIPYDYLAIHGNFILEVEGEDLPDWEKFGTTQAMYYTSPGELLSDA